jgi:hypothetical protein
VRGDLTLKLAQPLREHECNRPNVGSDLLELDDEDIRREPLQGRRRRLLTTPSKPMRQASRNIASPLPIMASLSIVVDEERQDRLLVYVIRVEQVLQASADFSRTLGFHGDAARVIVKCRT